MDNFINLAKQGYQAYESSQSSNNQGGDSGDVQDRRYHESQAVPDIDHDETVNRASEHAGGSGDSSLFSSAINHLKSRGSGEHTAPIDEEHIQNAHQQAYSQGNAGNLDAGSMGAAAALQAFKSFTSSGSGGGGGGGSSQLISLAMGEASKLFDSAGGSSSGGKQEVINGAAMTMMKLVVQSKLSGVTGGSNSGGLGSIMGMASKFL
ncbi:hypothetical protein K439DRAFT_206227 [Ramaria rubella]|nr:hypothetical protein K439DRAFT_206227 [Ramaria rubella]